MFTVTPGDVGVIDCTGTPGDVGVIGVHSHTHGCWSYSSAPDTPGDVDIIIVYCHA